MIIVRGNFCLVSILKLPLISITLASLLPLITTVAPISGSALDSSATLPLITLWALTVRQVHKKRNNVTFKKFINRAIYQIIIQR